MQHLDRGGGESMGVSLGRGNGRGSVNEDRSSEMGISVLFMEHCESGVEMTKHHNSSRL